MATRFNKSYEDIVDIWKQTGVKDAYDWRDIGLVTGVRYLDQVEEALRLRYMKNVSTVSSPFVNGLRTFIQSFSSGGEGKNQTKMTLEELIKSEVEESSTDYTLDGEFIKQPRRSLPATPPPATTASATAVIPTSSVTEGDAPTITTAASDTPSTTDSSTTTRDSEKTAAKAEEKNKKYLSLLKAKKNSLLANGFPAGLYLKKMKKGDRILQGLPTVETYSGDRIAIINAVGGISSGKSGNGANGRTLGSDTLIELIGKARRDRGIKACVLRVDSPV